MAYLEDSKRIASAAPSKMNQELKTPAPYRDFTDTGLTINNRLGPQEHR